MLVYAQCEVACGAAFAGGPYGVVGLSREQLRFYRMCPASDLFAVLDCLFCGLSCNGLIDFV